METISMNNESHMRTSFPKLGAVWTCYCCDAMMVRTCKDMTRVYKGVTLTMQNFPYWQCTDPACNEALYGAGTLAKHLIRARELYDTTGETVYDCLLYSTKNS